jgi:aspartyl-tRNA(Asn)/glutamyl-tRNA(Gln) amidotransferase subunit A
VPAALDLVRVGRALRSGGTTSVRLTEECLLAIATWNSVLRAFITVSEERALDTAREADRELAAGYDRGPLHGIPISLKDIIDLAGTPTTAASDATSRDPVADMRWLIASDGSPQNAFQGAPRESQKEHSDGKRQRGLPHEGSPRGGPL